LLTVPATGQGQVSQFGLLELHPPLPSVQLPLPEAGGGQIAISQSVPSQSTSHSQDSAQSTTSQALLPLHVTSQGPSPQVTLPHALEPSQVTVHAVACEQSMSSHAFADVQLMSHENPAGQVT
jgi:hypothetical protein